MTKLKFVLQPVRQKTVKKTVIERGITATIILKDNKWLAHYKDEDYVLTESSYKTKGCRIVYSKKKFKYGRYKLYREEISLRSDINYGYIPFKENILAKGNIIEIDGEKQFKAISFYNYNSQNEKEIAEEKYERSNS